MAQGYSDVGYCSKGHSEPQCHRRSLGSVMSLHTRRRVEIVRRYSRSVNAGELVSGDFWLLSLFSKPE